MTYLDSDDLAERYRTRLIRRNTQEILVSVLQGSDQEGDLTRPPNCDGLGRIRHFRLAPVSTGWMPNPLPIVPACKSLALPRSQELQAQVFQNAACNWRCWYCYVPFNLLAADETRSRWVTAEDLVESYAALGPKRPHILDLTGGQPDLTPEWIPWTMDALDARGLADHVFLWSDDNLSNDYFWRYLTDSQISQVSRWPHYARVCCFKGFDEESFSFNTSAPPSLFARQFELFGRLASLGIDLYAYVTLTTPFPKSIDTGIPRFIDRLQAIHETLPLRVVPLEIQVFGPVKNRLTVANNSSMQHQHAAVHAFAKELKRRFPASMLETAIADIPRPS